MQCCGFGMIYSGSGSSYEFLKFRIGIQFRIWIQPILLTHTGTGIWKLLNKKSLNSIIKKKSLPTICQFLFHTTVLQYTQSRSFLFICSLNFCCIRNQVKVPDPCGSGSKTLRKCFVVVDIPLILETPFTDEGEVQKREIQLLTDMAGQKQ